MARTIKLEANDRMAKDLEELRQELGAATLSETLRRVIAREVTLSRMLKKHKSVRFEGSNAKGEEVLVA